MSAETKVDVLAVMDRAAGLHWDHEENADAEDMEAARAAVAELIEADREYDEARAEMDRRRNDITPLLWNRWVRALDRRAEALARIGGAK